MTNAPAHAALAAALSAPASATSTVGFWVSWSVVSGTVRLTLSLQAHLSLEETLAC